MTSLQVPKFAPGPRLMGPWNCTVNVSLALFAVTVGKEARGRPPEKPPPGPRYGPKYNVEPNPLTSYRSGCGRNAASLFFVSRTVPNWKPSWNSWNSVSPLPLTNGGRTLAVGVQRS